MFYSKPVLGFWIQSIAMATLGVHYEPGRMLIGSGQGAIAHPEWAVRVPIALFAILAMYFLYKGGPEGVRPQARRSSAASSSRRCPTGTSSRTSR